MDPNSEVSFKALVKIYITCLVNIFFSEIMVQRKLENHIILFMVISWQEIKLYCVSPSFKSVERVGNQTYLPLHNAHLKD